MKYHALFVIFEESGKIFNCRLLQIIGGALRVKLRSRFLKIVLESIRCSICTGQLVHRVVSLKLTISQV